MNRGLWRKGYAESWIIEANPTRHVTEAGDIDYTGPFPGRLYLGHEEVGQQERPHVIGAKLDLEAIWVFL